jgi:hypothetical protein
VTLFSTMVTPGAAHAASVSGARSHDTGAPRRIELGYPFYDRTGRVVKTPRFPAALFELGIHNPA